MCDPITMAAISAVQTASQISAANQAAEAQQNAAVERQRAMNVQRQLEMEETNKKAALELAQEKRKAKREFSASVAMAAESGVSGATTLRNLADVYMQESFKSGSIQSLAESDIVRIATQSQSEFLQTRSDINVAESKKTTGIAAALQIGGSAAMGYGAGGGFDSGMTLDKSVGAFKTTWSI